MTHEQRDLNGSVDDVQQLRVGAHPTAKKRRQSTITNSVPSRFQIKGDPDEPGGLNKESVKHSSLVTGVESQEKKHLMRLINIF